MINDSRQLKHVKRKEKPPNFENSFIYENEKKTPDTAYHYEIKKKLYRINSVNAKLKRKKLQGNSMYRKCVHEKRVGE